MMYICAVAVGPVGTELMSVWAGLAQRFARSNADLVGVVPPLGI